MTLEKSLIMNRRTIKTQSPISNGRTLNQETVGHNEDECKPEEGKDKTKKDHLQKGKQKERMNQITNSEEEKKEKNRPIQNGRIKKNQVIVSNKHKPRMIIDIGNVPSQRGRRSTDTTPEKISTNMNGPGIHGTKECGAGTPSAPPDGDTNRLPKRYNR